MNKPTFRFEHDAFRPETVTLGSPRDDRYRSFHFDLCRAVNMTSLCVVLNRMVEAGVLDARMAELYHSQAATLLALMTSENNRAFATTPTPSAFNEGAEG